MISLYWKYPKLMTMNVNKLYEIVKDRGLVTIEFLEPKEGDILVWDEFPLEPGCMADVTAMALDDCGDDYNYEITLDATPYLARNDMFLSATWYGGDHRLVKVTECTNPPDWNKMVEYVSIDWDQFRIVQLPHPYTVYQQYMQDGGVSNYTTWLEAQYISLTEGE